MLYPLSSTTMIKMDLSAPLKLLLAEQAVANNCDNDRKRKADDEADASQCLLFFAAAVVVCYRSNPFRDYLDSVGRMRRCRKLPRCALVEPHLSAWQRLYSSGHDGALITVTGHDHAAFKRLLLLRCLTCTHHGLATMTELRTNPSRTDSMAVQGRSMLRRVLDWC